MRAPPSNSLVLIPSEVPSIEETKSRANSVIRRSTRLPFEKACKRLNWPACFSSIPCLDHLRMCPPAQLALAESGPSEYSTWLSCQGLFLVYGSSKPE